MKLYKIEELNDKAFSKAIKNIAKVVNNINEKDTNYSIKDSFILEIVANGSNALFDKDGNLFSYDISVLPIKHLTSLNSEYSKRFSNNRLNLAVVGEKGAKALKGKAFAEIDYNMIPIITLLNEKNYSTTSCCEGHVGEYKRVISYISFKYDYDFANPIPLYDQAYSNRKKYSQKGVDKKLKYAHYHWYGTNNISFLEQEQEKKKMLEDLLKWAMALPKRKIEHFIELYGVKKYGKHVFIGKYNNDLEYKDALKKEEGNYVRTWTKEYEY